MLFNEVFGSYYQVTALVLCEAVKGNLTQKGLTELVQERAFLESVFALPQGLLGEKWRLLHCDLTTPIQEGPTMPLTLMQKRWLKALLLDPRIQLFAPDTSGLEDVEPLFRPDMCVTYDRYHCGDSYTDPEYIAHFQTILKALREKDNLYVRYSSSRQRQIGILLTPHYLEYSEKDDRFRLIASDRKRDWIINLAGISSCELVEGGILRSYQPKMKRRMTFELVDRRNALERVLLHFSHLEKETERVEEDCYRVTLYYDPQDETELVIRMLSFGPVVRVLEPVRFIDLLRQRIERQMRSQLFCHESPSGLW